MLYFAFRGASNRLRVIIKLTEIEFCLQIDGGVETSLAAYGKPFMPSGK